MNKKKNYFIISSIIIIVFSIISILNADASREAMLEVVSKLPGGLAERMASVYSNNAIFIIPSVISIIIGLIILIVSLMSSIARKKNLILGLSIFLAVVSGNTFVFILSIVNIVLAINIKREDASVEKKNIPALDRYSSGIKGIIFAALCFCVYFSQEFIFSLVYSLLPNFNQYVSSSIIYVIVLSLIITLFWDNLKRDLKAFKNGYKEYVSFVLPRLGIIYILYFIFSFVSVSINKNMPVNQQQIESLPIWFTLPLASLLAPIVEEILFRGCIRRFIKNDVAFIIVSGIVFGLLHTISEGSISGALLMAIPYSVLGSGFAYIYAKTNNITNTILCHSCHNTIVMILQMIFL